MPSLSEGQTPITPLRKRDVHGANTTKSSPVEPNPTTPSTEVGDSYSTKALEFQHLMPQLPADAHGVLSSGRLDGTPHHLDPPNPIRTSRTSTRRFERPDYLHILVHAAFCCVAYPIVYAGTVAAKDRSLFWARVIVGLWCAGIGVVIGWSLVAFATKYAEAATWATVIHLSHSDDGSGIKLKDLAHNAHHAESAVSGFRLLWTRFNNRGTDRRARKAVDPRPWSFFIAFYVCLIFSAGALPFILGRVINISTRSEHQLDAYTEATIWGDLSESDVAAANAQLGAFTDYVRTWTLAAFTDRSSLPTAVRLKSGQDSVYFAELTQSQLKPNGTGLGAFVQNGTISDEGQPATPSAGDASEGSLLKAPRWGIRMHCEKLPEPQKYLVPRSNAAFTYVIVTRALLEGLFSSFALPLPDRFKTPKISFLGSNDTLPSGVSPGEVAYIAGFWDNGVAHSFHSIPAIKGDSGNGWVGAETVLVRLNNSYTHTASFPVWGPDTIVDASGFSSRIGYDAVVCVEMYEPWILEIYNSSLGVPTTMAIVNKSASTDFETDHGKRGPYLGSYVRALNSTGKDSAYDISHDNSINQMLKDNGMDRWYVPSPTTVSFTGNAGPEGYTELSPQFYADVRGKADSSNVLPFLSGTRPIVVRTYKDTVLASASFQPGILAGVLGAALLLGALAGFFVPALPFDIPRRGFGLFSWVAALQGQELGGELAQDSVDRHMDLGELERTLGEKRVHFVI